MTAAETERVVCRECAFEDELPPAEARQAADHHHAVTGHDVEQEVEAE